MRTENGFSSFLSTCIQKQIEDLRRLGKPANQSPLQPVHARQRRYSQSQALAVVSPISANGTPANCPDIATQPLNKKLG
jgi:hypothetical protein